MQSQQEFEVDFFRPEDAEGIGRLFRAVYGEGYPVRILYDPKALTEANSSGEYYSIVARTTSGEIIGATHLFRSAPFKSLYEIGAGLVLKEYRKLGINREMMSFTVEKLVPQREGIQELFGEPVCNHTALQKSVAEHGLAETGLELALMPAEAYTTEGSAPGRVAALSAFRCYKSSPHQVFLPVAYEAELQFIYSGLDDARYFVSSEAPLPTDVTSEAQMDVFDFAQVARIAVHQAGGDSEGYLGNLELQALDRKVLVIQVWVKLGLPWAGAVVDILRRKGYFLGGVLPRWFDCDGMLMQKLLCEPDFESIRLYTDRARTIFDMVKQDWKRAQEA
jgi:hypothetical protein